MKFYEFSFCAELLTACGNSTRERAKREKFTTESWVSSLLLIDSMNSAQISANASRNIIRRQNLWALRVCYIAKWLCIIEFCTDGRKGKFKCVCVASSDIFLIINLIFINRKSQHSTICNQRFMWMQNYGLYKVEYSEGSL